jgi:uncharacterized membrane protein
VYECLRHVPLMILSVLYFVVHWLLCKQILESLIYSVVINLMNSYVTKLNRYFVQYSGFYDISALFSICVDETRKHEELFCILCF